MMVKTMISTKISTKISSYVGEIPGGSRLHGIRHARGTQTQGEDQTGGQGRHEPRLRR